MKSLTLQSETFIRGVEDIVTKDELARMLQSKKQLRIKLGIDATAPELHIGHAVALWKIRELQEAGHKAVIILGEFTTRIGDPTDKSTTRPILSPEIIKKNIASLSKQVETILLSDPKRYELRKNSEWYGKMKTEEFLRLCLMVTHSRLIERDMFQERIKSGKEITIAEMLYPILQGYDSVMIKDDLTIIGSDQLFNEHMGRFFQERFEQAPQAIVTLKLLPGLDGGSKMSKSLGNYIALSDTPEDKFGKAMRILDDLIVPYLEVYTDVPGRDIEKVKHDLAGGGNPRDAKLIFAEALVRRYHGKTAASAAHKAFLSIFSERNMPEDMPEVRIRYGMWRALDLLDALGVLPSKAECRRLLNQKAVEIDGRVVESSADEIGISKGSVIRVGKRTFVKIA